MNIELKEALVVLIKLIFYKLFHLYTFKHSFKQACFKQSSLISLFSFYLLFCMSHKAEGLSQSLKAQIANENSKVSELEAFMAEDLASERDLPHAMTTLEFRKMHFFDFMFPDQGASFEYEGFTGEANIQNWCIAPEVKTASEIDGMARKDEATLRLYASDAISKAGILLRLPMLTISSGQELFHRFSHR